MKKKIFWGILILIVIVLVFAFVNKGTKPEGIKLGVIAPLSGQYGAFGESIRDAIKLGLEGTDNIQVVFEDSQFNAAKGIAAYKKLTSIDKVDLIINVDSPTIDAIQETVEKDNMVVLQIFEPAEYKKDSIFQVLPSTYSGFTKLAEEAGKRYGSVALLYSGDLAAYLKDADYFRKGIAPEKVKYEAKITQSSDINSEVTKLLAQKTEATTIIVDKDTGIKLLKALANQKGNQKLDIICDMNTEFAINDYTKALGGSSILNGCISTSLVSAISEQFKKDFKSKYGYEPQIASDYAYDAITIVKKLLEIPKKDWQKEISKMNFNGVSGNIQFDDLGVGIPKFQIRQLVDGKFVDVK